MTPTEIDKGNCKVLLALLTYAVKLAGGSIRIPAAELHDTNISKGFTKRWDNNSKELVLEVIPASTDLYMMEESCQPMSLITSMPQQNSPVTSAPSPVVAPSRPRVVPIQQVSPLSASQEGLAEQMLVDRPQAQRIVTSDDQRSLDLEIANAKRKAIRDLENNQPVSLDIPSTPSYQTPSRQRAGGLPPIFYK